WCITDRVEYYYRGDVEQWILSKTGVNQSLAWLGTLDDLVMVVKRTSLGQAMPTETRSSSFKPNRPPWHSQVMLYRYVWTEGGGGTDPGSIEIKGAWSPEQVENFARQQWPVASGTSAGIALVDLGHTVAGTAGAVPSAFDAESAAWGLMTLSDH